MLGRIIGNAGLPITQRDIESISYTVRDLTTAVTINTGTMVVASCVYNALVQTDPRWTADNANTPGPNGQPLGPQNWGYNFAAVLPPSVFGNLFTLSDPDTVWRADPHQVQVTVYFTPYVGAQFSQIWRFTPLPTY